MAILREFGRGALNLLYPGVCPACQQLLADDETQLFCPKCRGALCSANSRACPRCSTTLGPNVVADEWGCPRCRDDQFAFVAAMRLAPYDGLIRELILRMKRRTGEALAEQVGRLWAAAAVNRFTALGATVVIPVPLHWRRRWWRGFNQSEILAHALADRLNLPCRPRWLRRVRATEPQTLQTPSNRRVNVRRAFAHSRFHGLGGATVLLVDDVMTTGSTASAAASALRAGGAEKVFVGVLAHG